MFIVILCLHRVHSHYTIASYTLEAYTSAHLLNIRSFIQHRNRHSVEKQQQKQLQQNEKKEFPFDCCLMKLNIINKVKEHKTGRQRSFP
jgi:hypothetical protein